MQDFNSSSSFNFLKGYREQTQKQGTSINVSALDVLDLFSSRKDNSLTSTEITSWLMITRGETFRLIEELKNRELVKTKRDPEIGIIVELTNRGKQIIGKR